MDSARQVSGMRGFTVVWIGQVVSLLGTSMTGFALTIWAYQITGSATALALVGFFFTTPLLIVSPIAGALVDRSNRKLMMMVSDLASGLATIGIFVLYLTGQLQIWHLYIASIIEGTFQTFQWPAYSAAITMMVPKEQYTRANAMTELAGNTSGIFAPLLAGALLPFIKLPGILMFDIASFLFAIGALLIVHIPQPKMSEEGRKAQGSLLKESAFGFRYIFQRRSLLGLQCVFLFGNFFATVAITLIAPMILARTNNNSLIFGSVETAGAVGGVVGGILFSAWGGPKRRVYGVLGGWMLSGIFGIALLGLGHNLVIWAIASFLGAALVPVVNSSNQAIWQAKVSPDIQGRVFATRRLIAWGVNPLATLLAGPLADYVMEPAARQGGSLTGLLGPVFGIGPGAGMAAIIFVCGLFTLLVGLVGYSIRMIRDVEILMPDASVEAAEAPGLAPGAAVAK